MNYNNVDQRRMRKWVGRVIMKNPDNGDQKFTVETYGFDKGEALAETNNLLKEWRQKGYSVYSIDLTTDETPLLTEDEVLEQLKNEGIVVA